MQSLKNDLVRLNKCMLPTGWIGAILRCRCARTSSRSIGELPSSRRLMHRPLSGPGLGGSSIKEGAMDAVILLPREGERIEACASDEGHGGDDWRRVLDR